MKIKNRLIHYILLGLIVASTLTATLSPVVSAQGAVDNMAPTDVATSWQFYNALSYCISKAMLPSWPIHDTITASDAANGKWFYNAAGSSYQARIGYFLADTGLKTNGSGLVDCGGDNVDWVSAAAKLWGYPDTIALLCDAGGFRKDNSPCHDGSGDFKSTNYKNTTQLSLSQFQKNVGGKIYGGTVPSLTQPSFYPLYQKPFFSACLGSTAPAPYTGTATGSFIYDVTVVNMTDFSTSTVHYLGVKPNTENIEYAVNTDLSTANKTCQQLAQEMNGFANPYANYLKNSAPAAAAEKSAQAAVATGTANSTSSCAIQGVGWIICPVVGLLANISDGAFGFLSNNFLKTNTAIIDTASPTYTAWSVMRSIANVAFVIVFLIIIFSQLSNIGIGNYGVKKMLPRLIIAAILVNISYFVCQIAVDVSNILGFSLKGLFDNIINVSIPSNTSSISTGQGFAGVAGGVLAFAGAAVIGYALLATLIPVILAALVALVMILFILIARQALIVLLIVISPLAFVAFLLPNTESWFKKWQKTLTAMLLLFPIIAVVFGASTLASNILTNTYSANFAGDTSASAMFGQLIGSLVLVLPLFVVPGLLKKSLDGVGSIGARINGIGGKLGGALGKKGSQGYEGSRLGQFKKYREGEKARRRAKIQSGTYTGRGGKLNPRNAMSGLNAAINQSRLSGKFGDRSTAQGAALQDAEDAELVKNATARLDYFTQPNGNPLSQAQMMQIATGQDVTADGLPAIDPVTHRRRTGAGAAIVGAAQTFDTHARKAAIQKAAKIATISDAQRLNDASTGMTAGERTTLTQSLAGSGVLAKAPWLSGPNLGDIEQGVANSDASALRAINSGKITPEVLANTDASGIETLLRVAAPGTPERATLQAAYAAFMAQPLLQTKVTPGSDYDIRLRSI